MMQQNASAWWEAVNQQLTTTALDCWSTLTLSAGHARVLKPPADAGSKCQMRHKTLTLTFGESLWDPISNYIGLCQSKVYRMSTVTGNLYIVYRLCTVEWAPSFYIRPLDDDLTNLKGSHMLEKRHLLPTSHLYTKSQLGSAVEALFDRFLYASWSSEPSLELQSATVFDICCRV